MPREKPDHEPMFATLSRLSQDARSWIAAEATLAQAEVASDGKRLAQILGFLVFVTCCLSAAMLLLVVFAVTILAHYVGGLAMAAGLLSLSLIVLAGLASWRIWYLYSKQSGLMTVFKRWWTIAARGPGRATNDQNR